MINESEVDRVAGEIEAHGFSILREVISPQLCDEVLEELARLASENVERNLDNDLFGRKTVRYHDVLNLGNVWQKLPIQPPILGVARRMLGDDCLLNAYGVVSIGPGEKHQIVHTDDAPIFKGTDHNNVLRDRPRLRDGGRRQSIVVNAMVALSDFTADNGATRLVPDSHKLPYPKPEESDAWYAKSIPAIAPKGSVVFWDGQCFHCGGANTTADQWRHGVAVDFCAGYLRTQENFLLSLPAERVETFPDELQHLIGLRHSRSGLGHAFTRNPTGLVRKVAITGNTPAH